MLRATTAIQSLKLLVSLTVAAAAAICCAEEVCMLGRLTNGTLAVSHVTNCYFTCTASPP